MGYSRAGFEVVGVDIKPQPHYPFEFHQADALTYPLDGFDVYHASPPCQRWSVAGNCQLIRKELPDLIAPIRERLVATGKPYVMENVLGAPLHNGIVLCGTMFGLKVRRHRRFEASFDCYFVPMTCGCGGKDGYSGVHRNNSSFDAGSKLICVAGHIFKVADGCVAMGINWMTGKELAQAIPPAYTEYIGKELMKALNKPPPKSQA